MSATNRFGVSPNRARVRSTVPRTSLKVRAGVASTSTAIACAVSIE
ncbi:hypothetical protein [Methylobacterium nigriterrae]